MQWRTESVESNGIHLNVATAGEGPALLLLHGFPHTHRLWDRIAPELAKDHRVIAPDLRGIGGSDRPEGGYDAATQALDLVGVLDGLSVDTAAVIAIDAGVAPAFPLVMEHPDRVRRFVAMEALIGVLPGAEDFLAGGAPWWFGFHGVPGLAERVVVGHEDVYIDFFLTSGTADGRGVGQEQRDAFVDAYRGEDALRAAFEHYRAIPGNAAQAAQLVERGRLRISTIAIGGNTVGEATYRQLAPLGDDVRGHVIADSGHIIPLDRPEELLRILADDEVI